MNEHIILKGELSEIKQHCTAVQLKLCTNAYIIYDLCIIHMYTNTIFY